MKDAYILKTVSLYTSADVVHIEGIMHDQDETMIIDYDARALLEDIPSLYRMAKQAIKQGEEYETRKFVDFMKELSEEYKGKRARKKQ